MPPPGYGNQGYPAPPAYGAPSATPGAFGTSSTGAPTNPWIPGALVSFFFPGLGLFFLPDQAMRTLGIKIFVAYLGITVVLPIALGIVGTLTGMYGLWSLWQFIHLARAVAHPLSLVHTHDVTVRMYPALGTPILFKK